MQRLVPLVIGALLSVTGCSFGTAEQEPAAAPKSTASLNPSTQEEQSHSTAQSIVLTLRKTYKDFQAPTGLAVDHSGNLYVANWSGDSVTRVAAAGNYSMFADGLGSPAGLAFDPSDNLYVADYAQDVIYKITPREKKAYLPKDCIPLPA